jgi:hypothetical protein
VALRIFFESRFAEKEMARKPSMLMLFLILWMPHPETEEEVFVDDGGSADNVSLDSVLNSVIQ